MPRLAYISVVPDLGSGRSCGTWVSACSKTSRSLDLLKPTGHVMHHQFNIQQLYALPTLYLCVLYFIHLVVCLTTGPKPLLKRALHIVRSRASSFKWEYPLLSLRSSSSFLRLLPCLLVTSIRPCIFPSITRCKRFVFIWEQTTTCATYSINYLVFITVMKSVYSAVRTGALNKAVCALSLKG
jgi:hypothetical protein